MVYDDSFSNINNDGEKMKQSTKEDIILWFCVFLSVSITFLLLVKYKVVNEPSSVMPVNSLMSWQNYLVIITLLVVYLFYKYCWYNKKVYF